MMMTRRERLPRRSSSTPRGARGAGPRSRGTQSRRDRRNLREYQDRLEGALGQLGEIRSYRGKFMRQTLFQTLQAHAASMWSHAAHADAPPPPHAPEEEGDDAFDHGFERALLEEGDEDSSADADFMHPDDQAFLEAQRQQQQQQQQQLSEEGQQQRPQSGKRLTVRELSSARRGVRPGGVVAAGTTRVASAKPPPARSSSSSNSRPVGSAGAPATTPRGAQTPLKNRKASSASSSARPGSAVVVTARAVTKEQQQPSPHRPPSSSNSKALKPYTTRGGARGRLGRRPHPPGPPSTTAAPPRRLPSGRRAPPQQPQPRRRQRGVVVRPQELVALRGMAAVCPTLMALEPPTPRATANSSADGRPSTMSAAIIAPRPLSSRPMSRVPQPSSGARGASSSSAGTPMRVRSASRGGGMRSNWEPKVEFYAQDTAKAFNPSDVSKKLLMAECPEDVEHKLRKASAKLAGGPVPHHGPHEADERLLDSRPHSL